MNNARRKQIAALADRLSALAGELEELKSSMEDIESEEEEYRDNMPENFQNSERYEKADAAVDALESAVSSLEEVASSIEECREYLEQAQEQQGARQCAGLPFLLLGHLGAAASGLIALSLTQSAHGSCRPVNLIPELPVINLPEQVRQLRLRPLQFRAVLSVHRLFIQFIITHVHGIPPVLSMRGSPAAPVGFAPRGFARLGY